MSKNDFDFNKALEQLQSGQGLTGKDGVLTPLNNSRKPLSKQSWNSISKTMILLTARTVRPKRPSKPVSVSLN
jgi:hypothetical protein